MKRSMALGAALLALGAGGAALGQKAAAGGVAAARQTEGGLSVSPAVIEVQNAHTGALATMTIANRSAAPITVTVTPRPWLQATTGKVSPNRAKTLPGVSVSEGSFTLAVGAEKQVVANLNALPAGGALYGAMEVGYRVVGAIRLLPPAPRAAISAGKIKVTKGAAVLPIKNTGNTVDAVTGNVSVKTATGTKNLTVQAVKILPGNTVNISLGTKLIKGTATAKITLNQRGKKALSLSKKFTVK
jgi:hypothetical protein